MMQGPGAGRSGRARSYIYVWLLYVVYGRIAWLIDDGFGITGCRANRTSTYYHALFYSSVFTFYCHF